MARVTKANKTGTTEDPPRSIKRRRSRPLPPPIKSSKHAPGSQVEREIFARNFRRARIEADFSQRDVAKLTGIAQSHVSEIESARHNVGIDTMVKLAQLVRKPLHELMKP
jgi:DNA-binding XRE family transcriptional regulator